MDDKRAREILEDYIDNITHVGPVTEAIRFMLEQEPKIKTLGEELRSVRNGIKDENVLIGYNIAVAICNKYLSDNKEQEPKTDILDKIRAEIEELYSYVEFDEDLKTSFNMIRLEDVQKVLDKYKAESENT